MKKSFKILAIAMLVVLLLSFAGCGPYASEAGVYKCVELKMDGQSILKSYKYYQITLYADGSCLVESCTTISSSPYTAHGTFSIGDGKITLVSKVDGQLVTETYDYHDGVIIMKTYVAGAYVYGQFSKGGKK